MKQIFIALNLDTAFTDLCPCDLDSVILKFKDVQNTLWKNEIAKKPKLRIYKSFKSIDSLEQLNQKEYVNFVT